MTDTPLAIRLDPAACLDLLSQSSVGRVAMTMGALPVIRTVRFALAGDEIVFRVPVDSRLRRAIKDTVVAFSADHCDDRDRFGWSVVVQGVCGEVNDHGRVRRFDSLDLLPWRHAKEADREVYMAIPTEEMTGEAIRW